MGILTDPQYVDELALAVEFTPVGNSPGSEVQKNRPTGPRILRPALLLSAPLPGALQKTARTRREHWQPFFGKRVPCGLGLPVVLQTDARVVQWFCQGFRDQTEKTLSSLESDKPQTPIRSASHTSEAPLLGLCQRVFPSHSSRQGQRWEYGLAVGRCICRSEEHTSELQS